MIKKPFKKSQSPQMSYYISNPIQYSSTGTCDNNKANALIDIPKLFPENTNALTIPSEKVISGESSIEVQDSDQYFDNSFDEQFFITRSKTENYINSFLKNRDEINAHISKTFTNGSVFLTLLTTFITTEFNTIIFDKAVWQAVYLIILLVTGVLSIYHLIKIIRSKNRDQEKELQELLDRLRGKNKKKRPFQNY